MSGNKQACIEDGVRDTYIIKDSSLLQAHSAVVSAVTQILVEPA